MVFECTQMWQCCWHHTCPLLSLTWATANSPRLGPLFWLHPQFFFNMVDTSLTTSPSQPAPSALLFAELHAVQSLPALALLIQRFQCCTPFYWFQTPCYQSKLFKVVYYSFFGNNHVILSSIYKLVVSLIFLSFANTLFNTNIIVLGTIFKPNTIWVKH